MSNTFATLRVASAHNVLTITMNRPKSRNAYNEQMSVELGSAFRAAARDDNIRCIVLTGEGNAFCSGQDLAEIREKYDQTSPGDDLDFGTHLRKRYNGLIRRIRTIEKPVIASINGIAAGAGASFALACDLRIAARGASLMMAFVHVGLVPDSGATLTLVQQVGYARAAELCMLGEKLSAERAYAWGLVNQICDDERLPAETQQLAARLAAMPTRALGLTKRALNHAWKATLDDQLEYEAFLQHTAGNTADHREGVLAFLEKREPKFQGK